MEGGGNSQKRDAKTRREKDVSDFVTTRRGLGKKNPHQKRITLFFKRAMKTLSSSLLSSSSKTRV